MTFSSKNDKLEYWLIFQNNCLLIAKEANENKLPTTPFVSDIKNSLLRQHFLGHFYHSDVYCAELHTECSVPENLTSVPFKQALELLGNWYTIAAKAFGILNWDKNHQYCGRCGNITVQQSNTFERICSACALAFYPRISPSIIVLIQKDDQILMARSHHFIPGVYGLIAGFVEAGESIEDAVHREVKEEVAIEIKNLRYFGSQSWPFPDSLMIAFIADYASGDLTINPIEIEEAGWYSVDNLPGHPSSSISIAKKLIDHFISEQKKK